jgi:hypothetical protein
LSRDDLFQGRFITDNANRVVIDFHPIDSVLRSRAIISALSAGGP